MKTQILLFLLILLSFFSCRKDPTSTKEPVDHKFDFSSEWTYRFYSEYTGSVAYTVLDTTHYWFDGDTLMECYTKTDFNEVNSSPNTYLYHILRYNKRHYFNPQSNLNVEESFGILGYIREDSVNNRFYLTYADSSTTVGWEYLSSNEEALLWDFSLELGDSLEWNRWYEVQEGNAWFVQNLESLDVQGYQIEKLDFYMESTPEYLRTTMFRGIGSLHGVDRLKDKSELIHFHCDNFDFYP